MNWCNQSTIRIVKSKIVKTKIVSGKIDRSKLDRTKIVKSSKETKGVKATKTLRKKQQLTLKQGWLALL